jgi:hypothetical protein
MRRVLTRHTTRNTTKKVTKMIMVALGELDGIGVGAVRSVSLVAGATSVTSTSVISVSVSVAVSVSVSLVAGTTSVVSVSVVAGTTSVVTVAAVAVTLANITSARCSQFCWDLDWNTKEMKGRVVVPCSDIVTKESQEKLSGIIVSSTEILVSLDSDERKDILVTAIPHSGQLNITTSTPSTPE